MDEWARWPEASAAQQRLLALTRAGSR